MNPASGQLVSLIVQHFDTEVFQAFPGTMAAEAPGKNGKRVLLVLDNASWHKTKRPNWHHIGPIHLPPYSPDFNPIERLWQHPSSHHPAGLPSLWRSFFPISTGSPDARVSFNATAGSFPHRVFF